MIKSQNKKFRRLIKLDKNYKIYTLRDWQKKIQLQEEILESLKKLTSLIEEYVLIDGETIKNV